MDVAVTLRGGDRGMEGETNGGGENGVEHFAYLV